MLLRTKLNTPAKAVLLGAGVGTATFVVCWIAATLLSPRYTLPPPPAPPATSDHNTALTIPPPTVDPGFGWIKPRPARQVYPRPDMRSDPRGFETAAQAEHGRRINAVAVARVVAREAHMEVSDTVIDAAYDDSPNARGYTAFAELPRSLTYSEIDKMSGLPRDLKIACFSVRDPSGGTNSTRHLIIRHDAMHFLGGNYGGDASLPEWITSGCAGAIRDRSRTLSPAQLNTTLADMLPKTPEYDDARLGLRKQLVAAPPVRYAWWPYRTR